MKWRFIDTGFNNPYMNMAIDEAIVQLMEPDDPPVLRFFDWEQPAISIGYSQKISDVLNIPLCKKEKMPLVRRPTGGGVVFHGVDITYSVILPFLSMKKDSIFLIQSWVRKGIDKLGIIASQCGEVKKNLSGYCFVSPSFGDIMIEDEKIGGLAGRRIRRKMLFQGYLYYDNAGKMTKFCKEMKFLKGKGMYLKKYINSKDKIKKSIANNWYAEIIKGKLNDKEEELAGILCENKYSQDEWNFRRQKWIW